MSNASLVVSSSEGWGIPKCSVNFETKVNFTFAPFHKSLCKMAQGKQTVLFIDKRI